MGGQPGFDVNALDRSVSNIWADACIIAEEKYGICHRSVLAWGLDRGAIGRIVVVT